MVWHRDKLKLTLMERPYLSTVFEHIIARDVVRKLAQVREKITTKKKMNEEFLFFIFFRLTMGHVWTSSIKNPLFWMTTNTRTTTTTNSHRSFLELPAAMPAKVQKALWSEKMVPLRSWKTTLTVSHLCLRVLRRYVVLFKKALFSVETGASANKLLKPFSFYKNSNRILMKPLILVKRSFLAHYSFFVPSSLFLARKKLMVFDI